MEGGGWTGGCLVIVWARGTSIATAHYCVMTAGGKCVCHQHNHCSRSGRRFVSRAWWEWKQHGCCVFAWGLRSQSSLDPVQCLACARQIVINTSWFLHQAGCKRACFLLCGICTCVHSVGRLSSSSELILFFFFCCSAFRADEKDAAAQ